MITTGNPDQWDPSYPGRELLVKNITDGQAYVLAEKGRVHGTFAFIVGEEPTYTKICDGQWRKNEFSELFNQRVIHNTTIKTTDVTQVK